MQIIIDLEELRKAKRLIDTINSVDLTDIVWIDKGKVVNLSGVDIEEWQTSGLHNIWFAYEFLMDCEL